MLAENQFFGNNWLHVEMSKINLLNITFKEENITNSLTRYSNGISLLPLPMDIVPLMGHYFSIGHRKLGQLGIQTRGVFF